MEIKVVENEILIYISKKIYKPLNSAKRIDLLSEIHAAWTLKFLLIISASHLNKLSYVSQ